MKALFDDLLEHLHRIVFPLLDEFFLGEPTDHGKVLQGVAAGLGSNLHVDQSLGHGGTARLGLYADRRQRGSETQHLGLGQADLLTGTGNAHCHGDDGFLGSGEVVTQLCDRRADIPEQRLVGTHDVGELGKAGGRCIRVQVSAAVRQVNHDAGEFLDVLRGDTQLTAGGHDVVSVVEVAISVDIRFEAAAS